MVTTTTNHSSNTIVTAHIIFDLSYLSNSLWILLLQTGPLQDAVHVLVPQLIARVLSTVCLKQFVFLVSSGYGQSAVSIPAVCSGNS
jgi:hypothetical protein